MKRLRGPLARDLKTRVDGKLNVVESPDHPYLMTPPDILVSEMGKILAVVIPSAIEIAAPFRLLARLALIRLALPAHTFCLLVGGDKTVPPAAFIHFDEYVDHTTDFEVLKMLRSSSRPGSAMADLEDQRKTAFRRAHVFLEESTTLTATDSTALVVTPQAAATTLIASNPRYWVPLSDEGSVTGGPDETERIRTVGDRAVPVMWAAFRGGATALVKCRTNVELSAACTYGVVHGTPVAKRSLPTFLILNRVPVVKHDPDQPIRAMALAGGVVSQGASPESLLHALERIRSRLTENDSKKTD